MLHDLSPVPHSTLRISERSFLECSAEIRADTSMHHAIRLDNCDYNAFHFGISKQYVDIK